ncbi:MAG: hypothetical protein AAF655_12570 [Bacteroidota bacterium]
MSDNKFGQRRKRNRDRNVEYPDNKEEKKGGRPADFPELGEDEIKKLSLKIPFETFKKMYSALIESEHKTYNQFVNAAILKYVEKEEE